MWFNVKEKLPQNDQSDYIEEEVWLGAGVIILKGVTFGKGSILSTESFITKDVEPYSVYGGIPVK